MLLPIFPNSLLLPSNVYLVQFVEADFQRVLKQIFLVPTNVTTVRCYENNIRNTLI